MSPIRTTAGRRSALEKFLIGQSDWAAFSEAAPKLAKDLNVGHEAALLALNTLRYRLALGLTLPQTVKGSRGVSRNTLLRIETGSFKGTQLGHLIELSMVLKVRVRDLFEPHDIHHLPSDFLLHPAEVIGRSHSRKA
jgi:hypothetical protein